MESVSKEFHVERETGTLYTQIAILQHWKHERGPTKGLIEVHQYCKESGQPQILSGRHKQGPANFILRICKQITVPSPIKESPLSTLNADSNKLEHLVGLCSALYCPDYVVFRTK